jgi:hypothetical protein
MVNGAPIFCWVKENLWGWAAPLKIRRKKTAVEMMRKSKFLFLKVDSW